MEKATTTHFMSIIADEIYGFLENKGILLEEQTVCRRNLKGT